MKTFAHINDGYVQDPRVCETVEEYKALFPEATIAEWAGDAFAEIPDGTMHNAKDNGDGTYTNPAPVEPPKAPPIFSKTAFQDYAVSQLGGSVTGMARFTEIMDATRDSANGAVRFAFARYEAAVTFEKTNTDTLTAIMAADTTTNHLTTGEQTAIITNWPTA